LAPPHPAAVPAPFDGRSYGVTRRVVMLSLALAFFMGYVIPIIDLKLSNTFLGAKHLPPGAIAVLLVLLLLIGPLLRLFGQRYAFSRNEILTVYITCLFSCLVPGHGGENVFVSTLIGPFYFANAENKWMEFLQPALRPWLTPALTAHGAYNSALVEGWYNGTGGVVPWLAWLVPLAAWSALVLASYVMLGCLSVMLRAQWSEREALSFPLLRLPLEMTEPARSTGGGTPGTPGAPFFRNRMMWAGFGVAAVIQFLNGASGYFPEIPTVPLSINTDRLFVEVPWNQIQGAPMVFWPLVVGIAYLLTSEVSFSLWFFYWFVKLQLILAYYLGFSPLTLPKAIGGAGRSFVNYQQVGAYIAYSAIVLWLAREHLGYVLRRAFGRTPAKAAERHEALSYPVAFWGFVLSLAFLLAWSVLAGIRADIALLLWLSYLVIAIALTRLVVEGGLLFVQQGWTPLGAAAQLLNSGPGTWLAPSSIVPASFLQASTMVDMSSFLMPSFVQSFKLAYDQGIKPRRLLALIAAVTCISFGMSLWMNVKLGYAVGGLQLNRWFAQGGAVQPVTTARDLIGGARDLNASNFFWLAAGMLITYGITVARSAFPWFPLHPLGYLTCLTYPMNQLWFSIFTGWLCKRLITRFGGTETYRQAVPAFLGLALGDVTMMLFWLLIDGWQGRVGHQMMPS
jgi:hypothetical protein